MDQRNTWTNSLVIASAFAAMASVIWVAASTIVGELHAPFKNFLKATFTHHWIGKGVIAVACFLFFTLVGTLLARKYPSWRSSVPLWILVFISVVGFFAIGGFYFYEDFLK